MTPEAEPSAERFPIGRSIMRRIREAVNDENGPFPQTEGQDLFTELYLRERGGCLPDELIGEDLLADIRMMFYVVLDALRDELRERLSYRDPIWVLVDPTWDDTTSFAMMTDEQVLLLGATKAWHFYWDADEEMAAQLEDWYQRSSSRLRVTSSEAKAEALRGYVVTLTIERILDVDASSREGALDRAVRWTDGEADSGLRMLYEEVVDHRVEDVGQADE